MLLRHLSIVNYKNIAAAELDFSPKLNCITGRNGMGKTNLLDAIYYLSFCRSISTKLDSQIVRHDEPYFMLSGNYTTDDGNVQEEITASLKVGAKKVFRRGGKAYQRLSEHIGLLPLVIVSPDDSVLVAGASEERRRLIDMVISQLDPTFIPLLNRYTKAWQNRNNLLKIEEESLDLTLLGVLEEQMAEAGEAIYKKRDAFVREFTPVFNNIYSQLSGDSEQVSLRYVSHCQRGPLLDVIRKDRAKDIAVGYSLHGVHRDDLEMLLGNYPMKRDGSQGQRKTYVIALKLAQFDFLRRACSGAQTAPSQQGTTPILLLDDIFDRLDNDRVTRIIDLVASDTYGQTFITDTDRNNLDRILNATTAPHALFNVEAGEVSCV